ncbi:hypothetical protein GCM10020000_63580 [Streptomyces olivoverticillatus]
MARGEGAAGATAGVKAAEAPALPPGRRGGRPWPGVTFVLGDTAAEAQEKAAEIRKQQVSPQTALLTLEQVWGRDLSGYDLDGPLPDIDPDPEGRPAQGRVRIGDPLAVAAKWRAVSEAKGLSIRQTVIETTGLAVLHRDARPSGRRPRRVRHPPCGGRLHPRPPSSPPGGLDDFVERVVPLLQERGAFRTEYSGHTLREHLGLARPAGKG